MKNVLFISYYFPPIGGAGVQRSAKFVKYLPEFGWRPIVLTVKPEDYQTVREFQRDDTLMKDVAGKCEVHHVRDPEPRRLRRLLERLHLFRLAWCFLYPLFWEKQFFWALAAARRARQLIREKPIEAIYTTSGPYSTIVTGWLLKRRTGLRWVADLRDLWTGHPPHSWPSRLHYRLNLAAERFLLRRADVVIANTPLAAERMKELLGPEHAERVTWIPNGYDADDIPPQPERKPKEDGVLTIAHVGTFQDCPPDLNGQRLSVKGRLLAALRRGYRPAPLHPWARSPKPLFDGLKLLFEEQPEMRDRIRVVLIGYLHPGWQRMIEQLRLESCVETTGYLPHDEAVKRLMEADVLYCVQRAYADLKRPVPYVPAKTYEYMASGKPILAPLPEGDTKCFLQESGLGLITDPEAANEMKTVLYRLCGVARSNRASEEFRNRFLRRATAAQLSELLSICVRPFPKDGSGICRDTDTEPVSGNPVSPKRRVNADCNSNSSSANCMVAIISWNGRSFLPDCVASLRAARIPGGKLVVVDNGSTDGSVEYLRETAGIELIELGRNTGYAAAVNVALREAHRNGFKYAFVMNPDMVLDPSCLASLVEAMETNSNVCVAGPAELSLRADECSPAAPKDTSTKEVRYVSGGAMMIDCQKATDVGLLDEDYFLYYEENDFYERVLGAGFGILRVGSAILWHYRGGCQNRRPLIGIYYTARNIILLARKNHNRRTRLQTVNRVLKLYRRHFMRASILWPPYFITFLRGFADGLRNKVGPGSAALEKCRK